MTRATPSRGAASATRNSGPCAAAATRACSSAQAGPAVRAGSARARGPPALPTGAGRGPRPVAGWLCQSPRAWAAAHVCRRHVRARPRGLRQLPLQKLLCRALRPARVRGPRRRGEEGPGAQRSVRHAGAAGTLGAVCSSACPAPAVSAARSPAGRGGVAQEPAARGARTALTPAAPRQAGARNSMVGSERDEPPVFHRPQR